MSSRSIRSYLPDPENLSKSVVVQARVSPVMLQKIREIAKQNQWNPSQVVRACLEKFVDDEKPKETLQLRKVNFDPESNKSSWK